MPRNYARRSIAGVWLGVRHPDVPPLHLFLLPIGCPSYDHTAHAPTIHPCLRTGPVVWCIMLQQLEKVSHSKGLQPMQPSFTPAAQLLWDAIPSHFQARILHNVSCPHCDDMTTMTDFAGEVHGRSLVLRGTCETCRGKVARVLEGAPVSEALKPGDRVIWWKRIPGGDYVDPVQATVLALTAKRVKIKADDDGDIVVRYVPRESLQRQG
jgi:hypothetical protein